MGLLEVAASLDDPKFLHLVLGLFFGFVLSITSPIVFLLGSYYSDVRRKRKGNRQAYDQLEDIHSLLDEELEKLSGKDHHVGDTKYFEELLLKVKDRCDHGLLMLEAKQGRYRALVNEFEKNLKMEREQVGERLKEEQQKHREEMHKLEEEMRKLKEKYEAMRWT
ncbi:hypothetical protein RchiOBHm_Chr6g0251661 [Rosa chinensis]|uniref:Uncharacterized protein n=1 Tax=Rosa chinensis TaxID=74649 RepID=A0A2P6PKW0_ROSCH|nr:hypothetical protein RchiOBHm_Chr6g0251661 [Rosa chinensis]